MSGRRLALAAAVTLAIAVVPPAKADAPMFLAFGAGVGPLGWGHEKGLDAGPLCGIVSAGIGRAVEPRRAWLLSFHSGKIQFPGGRSRIVPLVYPSGPRLVLNEMELLSLTLGKVRALTRRASGPFVEAGGGLAGIRGDSRRSTGWETGAALYAELGVRFAQRPGVDGIILRLAAHNAFTPTAHAHIVTLGVGFTFWPRPASGPDRPVP